MKAVVFTDYGPPEVLQQIETEKPVPQNNEVRIKIHATTVTAADSAMRRTHALQSRLLLGLRKPRKRFQILGSEFAGEIESVGKGVTRFSEGDQVYGFRGFGTGTYVEYKCVAEDGVLAVKPANLTFEEAAAVVDGATTALFFLRDKANIQRGQRVLINGASGSIGTFAVQLASYFGAHVTGVCSTANLALVKSLGADEVSDYTQTDFTRRGETYDIIFDTVGKRSYSQCKGSLKKNGIYLVTTGNLLTNYLQTLWTSMVGSKQMIFAMSTDKAASLVFLKALIEAGEIKPIMDRRYPLARIVDAHRYVDDGHKRGNVVITIE